MLYICNGFSESMKRDPNMQAVDYSLTEEEFIRIINSSDYKSVIGHEALAECLTKLTGKNIAYNRRGIVLNYDDYAIIISLNGRLPEHPTYVEYKGRLNYTFKCFRKQTLAERMEVEQKIKALTEGE